MLLKYISLLPKMITNAMLNSVIWGF